MAQIGEVHESPGEFEIEWRIQNFSSLFQNETYHQTFYQTAPFYFVGASWKMTLRPEEIDWTEKKVGALKIGLFMLSFDCPRRIEYSVGVMHAEGKKLTLSAASTDFPEYPFEHAVPRLLSRRMLEEKKLELLPSDVLTLTCCLKNKALRDITKSSLTRMFDVVDNLKKLANSGKNPDVVLHVDNNKFHVHRSILEGRSPVFADMFSHDFSDSEPMELTIQNIDCRSLDAALFHIYTGDTVDLTTENVLGIYKAADILCLKDMKEICLHFIRRNLNDKWIYDVMLFGENQKIEEIEGFAKNYFLEHAGRLIQTDYWKAFLRDNPDSAVKLLSSAVEKLSLHYP